MQRIVYLCYSLAYFYFMCVMLLTTLSDLPLLFHLQYTKSIVVIYTMYIITYNVVGLSLYIPCFRVYFVVILYVVFYIHMACLLLAWIVVYITFYPLSLTVNNIVYFIQHNLNLLSSHYSSFLQQSYVVFYTPYTLSYFLLSTADNKSVRLSSERPQAPSIVLIYSLPPLSRV